MLLNGIIDDFEGDKDMANIRVVGLPDGTEIKLNRTDPYGLINIDFKDKPTPDVLSGLYTSFELAKDAISIYANNLERNKKKKK